MLESVDKTDLVLNRKLFIGMSAQEETLEVEAG